MELPEPITRVSPEYPNDALRPGMEVTVVVQALVGRDGRVRATKVVQSNPVFEQAAEASIRQWVFKPARCGDKPVATWIAVPVKFAPPLPTEKAFFTDQDHETAEAITRIRPEYPAEVMRARIEGTVLVQALVGRDGRVKDIKVVKSIPALDLAAKAAVRQWVFKPAAFKGEPVAVWVAIPVRFSLH
jgi:protein TonB